MRLTYGPALLSALVACLLAATALTAAADTSLDLVSAYGLAAKSDPVFLAAESTYKAKKQLLFQAGGGLLPTIDGSADKTRFETTSSNGNYETSGYTLSVKQPVFNAALFSALGQARAVVQQAEAEFGSAQQDLMLRTAERYLGALAATDNVELAEAEYSAISRQLEVANGRLAAGLGTITEVHDARARHQLAEAVRLEANNLLADSLDALHEVTGEFTEGLRQLRETVPPVTPEPEDATAWVKTALENNLEIQARLAAYDAAHKQVGLERSGHLPTVDVVGRQRKTESTPAFTTDGTHNSVGVELTVPIFQGGIISSRTAQARHSREAARQNLEGSRRNIRRQTRTAYSGVISGIKRVEALKQAVVASQSALDAKTTGFEAGINTNLDVLDAQRDLFRTKRDYAQARYTYILDLLRLKKAAGQLSEEDLKQVNGWLQ
jgi:outer membrane protein